MIPYLCGGTFFSQLLRVIERTTTSNERIKGQKENLREQDVFRRLISIYRLVDMSSDAGDTSKTYASQFKKCQKSLATYAKFTDSDCRLKFDRDVRSGKSEALSMMSKFVAECIAPQGKEQLVRCLLGMIKDDESIKSSDEFCILPDGGSIPKSEICGMETYYIDSFLLGVWHFVIMSRAERNELGKDTYEFWYPKRDDYRGVVGNDITMAIKVENAKNENPSTSESTNKPPFEQKSTETAETKQFIDDATIVNINGGKVVYAKNIEVLNL